MWLLMRYILLRLLANMKVPSSWSFVVVRAMNRAYSSPRSMFGSPRSFSMM